MTNKAIHRMNNVFFEIIKQVGKIKRSEAAQNDPAFNDRVARKAIDATEIVSLLHSTELTDVKSADGKRSITVDPVELTTAYQCVNRLMDANPDFTDYGMLREFVAKFERQFMISRAGLSNAAQQRYVECLARSINNPEALFELLAAAPGGTDEQMALDLLFWTFEQDKQQNAGQ